MLQEQQNVCQKGRTIQVRAMGCHRAWSQIGRYKKSVTSARGWPDSVTAVDRGLPQSPRLPRKACRSDPDRCPGRTINRTPTNPARQAPAPSSQTLAEQRNRQHDPLLWGQEDTAVVSATGIRLRANPTHGEQQPVKRRRRTQPECVV